MKGFLIASVGALIVASAVACGSTDEGSGAAPASQQADLSQFPTPTRSQAAAQPTLQPEPVQTQSGQGEEASDTSDVAPLSQEELQQLVQRLRSGELSEEEAQQAIQRIQSQLGGGQGGGGLVGRQAVGTIESIEEGSIVVVTEVDTVIGRVGEATNVSITSVLEPAALTDGSQVMVVSERVEGSTLARTITIVPEEQGGFGRGLGGLGGGQGGTGGFGRGLGGLGGGQAPVGGFGGRQDTTGGLGGAQGGQGAVGNRPLLGTIESIADGGFTLETQQGPLPIAMNEETVVVETRQGTLADLEVGLRVRLSGAEDESGAIDARSVIVTPEGLDDIRGFGGG